MGESAIVKLLTENPWIGPRILDPQGAHRIRPASLLQHWKLPAITYRAGPDLRNAALNTIIALVQRPVEVTSYHSEYALVRQFADQVRMGLDHKMGQIGEVWVHCIRILPHGGDEPEEERYIGPTGESQFRAWALTQTYEVAFDEQIATA